MIFSEVYRTNIEDYGRNGKLSIEAILRILENIGSHHSDSVGDGIVKGSLNGTAWILSEWNIFIHYRPEYTKTLNVSTWSRGKATSCTSNRDYLITDENNSEIAYGSAKFILFDLNEGKLARISDDLLEKYSPEPNKKALGDREFPKMREPQEYLCEKIIPLRRCDIDFNSHVHNLSYLNFALEAMPEKEYLADSFTSVRILFKKQIGECESVVAKYAYCDDTHIVGIYSTDGTLHSLVQLN